MNNESNLSINSAEFKVLKSVLKIPEAPKVGINDPEFENLTEAEKLNDSQYRCLIYQLYPNEPTCGCPSLTTNAERSAGYCNSNSKTVNIDNYNRKSTVLQADFPVCRGGCTSSCCSSAWMTRWRQRQQQQEQQGQQNTRFETPSTVEEKEKRMRNEKNLNNGNDDKVAHFMSSYCVENQRSNELYNSTYCSDERIRGGGGSAREEEPGQGDKGGARGVEEVKTRQCPGLARNEFPKNSRYPMRYDDIKKTNEIKTYYLSSQFKNKYPESRNNRVNKFNLPDDCYYPGKDILNSRKNHSEMCTRKMCPHIDCLTRALEEAKEFVDSLGKVPGLPGLGLMDPSASPYYRAPREYEKIEDESQQEESRDLGVVNPRCGGPCNPGIKSTSTSPWTKATPFTIAVPGRGGIVREAIVPDSNYINKDKDNDELNVPDVIGPCGERQCKAKRKKIHRESAVVESVDMPVEYVDERKKKSYLMRDSNRRKYKFNRQKIYHAGPRGDGFKKEKKRKVKKKVKVYLASRSYSGYVYGHKNCNDRLGRVPAHMGWFWTEYQPTGKLKPRNGWRPGAISRRIREMIQQAKVGLMEKRNRPASVPSSVRSVKKLKTKSSTSLRKKPSRKFNFKEEDFKTPPTLYIQRRDGVYYFTMYPVKQESENTPVLEEPMKPLQFKIAPNKDDASGATSSVASDMDIEFSPPAALNRSRKKPDVVHVDTQVRQQEILDAFKPLVPEVKKVKPRKSVKKKKK